MRIFKRKFKRILILSLLITLPISIFFSIWTARTLTTYFGFDHIQTKLSTPKGTRLYRLGIMHFVHLNNQLFTLIGEKNIADINLYIDKNDYSTIGTDVFGSERVQVKSYMIKDNDFIKGKTKLRGDNYYHWAFPNKSWRFKTSKKNLMNGIRKNNFIILKSDGLFGNHLAYKLANSLNLLAPKSSLELMNVNNTSNGLKLMVEQIDEGFLRSKGRMPNDIYKGDNVAPKKYLGLAISDIFNSYGIWEKSAYNNHYPKENKLPLDQLLQDVNNNDYRLLDKQSFVAFMVYIDLIGSLHHDAQHNWMIYYDNYYERFYPIVWDSLAWHPEWLIQKKHNITSSSKFLEHIYNDYDYLYAKYKLLFHFFVQENKFTNLLEKTYSNTIKKLDKMKYSYTAGGHYRNNIKVRKDVDDLKSNITDRLKFLENTFFGKVNKEDYSFAIVDNRIRLSLNGNKLVKNIILKYNSNLNDTSLYIEYTANNKTYKHELPYSMNGSNEIIINQNLLPRTKIANKQTIFEEATYDISIDNFDMKNIENITLEFLNKNNERIVLNRKDKLEVRAFTSQQNIIKDIDVITNEIWSGTKQLSGFNIRENNILIKPGTKIIFDKNATLKILGKVTAIGTKEKPITFAAKDKTKPWNTLALKDTKANGSVFKHCIFKDGSGDKGDLYEYTAMFSVHNVKDLLVEDCEFYDSHRTDDMVHVIYSDATFKNTKFVRSLSDALDVDISNLVVDNCEFIDSGNDSIDLMTTNAIVINTKFTNSKDKGISIGEGSNLLAINNYIKSSEIGMQSKDTSQAYIYNTSFMGNKKAIDAYHKNWRYSEGGTIYLDKCLFEKNILNATVGKKSKVVINDSQVDTPDHFDTKSIKKKKIIISNEKLINSILPMIDTEPYINLIHTKAGYYGN